MESKCGEVKQIQAWMRLFWFTYTCYSCDVVWNWKFYYQSWRNTYPLCRCVSSIK